MFKKLKNDRAARLRNFLVAVLFLRASSAIGGSSCPFSEKTEEFEGTPVEQARCLLRKVLVNGNVSDEKASLPLSLAKKIGERTDLSKAKLKKYLSSKSISKAEIGGSIDAPLSQSRNGKTALYFVIHDTSDSLSEDTFPPGVNLPSWPPNDLQGRDLSVAHIFINRVGASASDNPYSARVTATKKENHESSLEGLMLHHELVQPRIKGQYRYHAVGPDIGFTQPQLRRLALLYIVSSVRKGQWLIPAFHCVIDQGIPDGHDDPQNFDLSAWAELVEWTYQEINKLAEI